jgi:hypothetical protein
MPPENQAHFTIGSLGRLWNVPAWRIRRLYEDGDLPEPDRAGGTARSAGYRLIQASDLPRVRAAYEARWGSLETK